MYVSKKSWGSLYGVIGCLLLQLTHVEDHFKVRVVEAESASQCSMLKAITRSQVVLAACSLSVAAYGLTTMTVSASSSPYDHFPLAKDVPGKSFAILSEGKLPDKTRWGHMPHEWEQELGEGRTRAYRLPVSPGLASTGTGRPVARWLRAATCGKFQRTFTLGARTALVPAGP